MGNNGGVVSRAVVLCYAGWHLLFVELFAAETFTYFNQIARNSARIAGNFSVDGNAVMFLDSELVRIGYLF